MDAIGALLSAALAGGDLPGAPAASGPERKPKRAKVAAAAAPAAAAAAAAAVPMAVDAGNKPTLTFVTGNKKKLEEVAAILAAGPGGAGALPFSLANAKIDLPELQGDPLEIAREKVSPGCGRVVAVVCLAVARSCGRLVAVLWPSRLALPRPASPRPAPPRPASPCPAPPRPASPTDPPSPAQCALAAVRVGGPVICEDTCLCFNALGGLPGPYIKWFLDKCGHAGLNGMLDGFADKSAYAQCVFGYCAGPGEEVVVFDGRTHGTIVPARGPTDFGWDPVFAPDDAVANGQTYAQMDKAAKNGISHRFRALEKLRAFLTSRG